MKAKLKYVIGAVALLIALVLSYVLINENKEVAASEIETTKTTESISDANEIYVDVKGSVKKPGVYQVKSDSIINDVIKMAGGFTKNAYTKNINLSQKVKDEMVIYVFSKTEITKEEIKNDVSCTTQVINYDNCIKEDNDSKTSSLVNINTASKEELMNISGIGASKADLIITYRESTPFSKIEDIMNVSGIGESLFEKIKKYITV